MTEVSTHRYLAVWDQQGLESLLNVTAIEQENIVSVLSGESLAHRNPVQYFILRARFNPQRHYEIYYFDSTEDQDDIEYMFRHNPQSMVDWIRQHGQQVYSDRETRKPTIT